MNIINKYIYSTATSKSMLFDTVDDLRQMNLKRFTVTQICTKSSDKKGGGEWQTLYTKQIK